MIFDFDGVLVDSEPLIMKLTQAMAAKEGWTLTARDYYRNYLALHDRGSDNWCDFWKTTMSLEASRCSESKNCKLSR